jgi:hypothetical protein
MTVQKFNLYFVKRYFQQLSFCKVDRTISRKTFFSLVQISMAMTSSNIVATSQQASVGKVPFALQKFGR